MYFHMKMYICVLTLPSESSNLGQKLRVYFSHKQQKFYEAISPLHAFTFPPPFVSQQARTLTDQDTLKYDKDCTPLRGIRSKSEVLILLRSPLQTTHCTRCSRRFMRSADHCKGEFAAEIFYFYFYLVGKGRETL